MKYHSQILGHLRMGVGLVGREVIGLVLEIPLPNSVTEDPCSISTSQFTDGENEA